MKCEENLWKKNKFVADWIMNHIPQPVKRSKNNKLKSLKAIIAKLHDKRNFEIREKESALMGSIRQ